MAERKKFKNNSSPPASSRERERRVKGGKDAEEKKGPRQSAVRKKAIKDGDVPRKDS